MKHARDRWVREEGTEDAWSPLESDNVVVTGMVLVGRCPGRDMGTFRFTENGDVEIRLNGRRG